MPADNAATVSLLTYEEERELSLARTLEWMRTGHVQPFTSAEAHLHAREFIVSNGPNNLVRLLAEAYLRLEAESNG